MRIVFSPMRADAGLTVVRTGDILVINGAEVDLATYDAAAAPDPWIAGQPVQEGGVWQVTLILPHGPDAPEAVRYPAPITVTGDGPVPLPG